MKGMLTPLLSLTAIFWLGLPAERQEDPPSKTSTIISGKNARDSDWLKNLLGETQPTKNKDSLSLTIKGLEKIPENSSAMQELKRWETVGLWGIHQIEAELGNNPKTTILRAKFQGEPKTTIRLLEHLLASPFRKGYLVDPGYLRIHRNSTETIHVDLEIRVTEADLFLDNAQQ